MVNGLDLLRVRLGAGLNIEETETEVEDSLSDEIPASRLLTLASWVITRLSRSPMPESPFM